MMAKRWMALVILVGVLSSWGGTAQASEPTEAITTPRLAKVVAYRFTHAAREVLRRPSGVIHGAVRIEAVNVAGIVVWAYVWHTDCRYGHRKVQSCEWETPHYEIPWYSPWEGHAQHIEARRGSLPDDTVYRRWRGHLKSCITWWCSNRYPYVALRFFGDGRFTRGGGLG